MLEFNIVKRLRVFIIKLLKKSYTFKFQFRRCRSWGFKPALWFGVSDSKPDSGPLRTHPFCAAATGPRYAKVPLQTTPISTESGSQRKCLTLRQTTHVGSVIIVGRDCEASGESEGDTVSTASHSPTSSYGIELVKGKKETVTKLKGCKASGDSKSDTQKLRNNIIVHGNALKTKLRRCQLLTSWWLGPEAGKFHPIGASYGVASKKCWVLFKSLHEENC